MNCKKGIKENGHVSTDNDFKTRDLIMAKKVVNNITEYLCKKVSKSYTELLFSNRGNILEYLLCLIIFVCFYTLLLCKEEENVFNTFIGEKEIVRNNFTIIILFNKGQKFLL